MWGLQSNNNNPFGLVLVLLSGDGTPDEKFFGNFPYPYMNGLLHLGHGFSLSKASAFKYQ
jgi:leucyl-tRNA synthetase